MKNTQLPNELANQDTQLLGETMPNLSSDHDDIYHSDELCTCGCERTLVDLRDHTETKAVCTNCSAVFMPDICIECGRDCRPANDSHFAAVCAECYE